MMLCTFYIQNQAYTLIFVAKITNSKIEGKEMIAIFYDSDQRPVKTVHVRAAGYPDYTISSHDDERQK